MIDLYTRWFIPERISDTSQGASICILQFSESVKLKLKRSRSVEYFSHQRQPACRFVKSPQMFIFALSSNKFHDQNPSSLHFMTIAFPLFWSTILMNISNEAWAKWPLLFKSERSDNSINFLITSSESVSVSLPVLSAH